MYPCNNCKNINSVTIDIDKTENEYKLTCNSCGQITIIACIKCKDTKQLIKHTATKGGKPRFACRCGQKPFVPQEIKRQKINPPCNNSDCDFYGNNNKVQILAFLKDTAQTRYICDACGKTFMRKEDYKERGVSEQTKNNIINSWLAIQDKNVWAMTRPGLLNKYTDKIKCDYAMELNVLKAKKEALNLRLTKAEVLENRTKMEYAIKNIRITKELYLRDSYGLSSTTINKIINGYTSCSDRQNANND